MTIIRPNRNKDVKRAIFLGGAGASIMLVAVLCSYVGLVSIKHDLEETRASLEVMKVASAELKNEYFQLTSAENLEAFASELGLVKDKSPGWVLASQY